jgi:anthranilate phosphoribosyltransferase
MVVHGHDGLDEITITGPTFVSELRDGEVIDYTIQPEDYEIPCAPLVEIQVNTTNESMASVLQVLNNSDGHKKNVVILNAGAAIYIGGKAATLGQGMKMAREAIESGNALGRLHALQEIVV